MNFSNEIIWSDPPNKQTNKPCQPCCKVDVKPNQLQPPNFFTRFPQLETLHVKFTLHCNVQPCCQWGCGIRLGRCYKGCCVHTFGLPFHTVASEVISGQVGPLGASSGHARFTVSVCVWAEIEHPKTSTISTIRRILGKSYDLQPTTFYPPLFQPQNAHPALDL